MKLYYGKLCTVKKTSQKVFYTCYSKTTGKHVVHYSEPNSFFPKHLIFSLDELIINRLKISKDDLGPALL